MAKPKPGASRRQIEELLTQKTEILSKAQALTTMGLAETAQLVWASAASYEERIAALLDAHGESLEAAVHRISAASCFQKAGDLSRAATLFSAALAGPLRDSTRSDVEKMLNDCLVLLKNQGY